MTCHRRKDLGRSQCHLLQAGRAGHHLFSLQAVKLLPGSGTHTPGPGCVHIDQQCWGQGLASRQRQHQISQVATSQKPHEPMFGVHRVRPLPLSQLQGPLQILFTTRPWEEPHLVKRYTGCWCKR